MHLGCPAQDDLEHPSVSLTRLPKNLLNRLSVYGAVSRNRWSLESFAGIRASSADLLDLVLSLADSFGKSLRATIPTNVHEVHLRIIVEEMVMQRRYLETVFQRHAYNRVHFILKQNQVTHHH
jgi:hypothetical protein